MGDTIRWAVSVTPVEELTDDGSGTHNVIHSSVGKSLDASGETAVSDLKYDSALEIPTMDGVQLTTDNGNCQTLFVKNNGSTPVMLSVDSEATYKIMVDSENGVLLHLSGVSANEIYAALMVPASATTIEYMLDAP